ncbi:hypothetical protein L618_004100000150 [Rhodococcus rhodochrous J45]|uniref:Uncharacterized protein n=1 Tax=Rhodococcus rhodochrous J45 TaxID=935266 RepID=A0A562DLA5_RHORH|nr:hypothetical protein L618_004100000150 [Rhodococcus rhodochrous J45]
MTYIRVSSLLASSAALLTVASLGNTPFAPTLVLLFLAISSLDLVFGNAAILSTEQVKNYAGQDPRSVVRSSSRWPPSPHLWLGSPAKTARYRWRS